MKRNLLLMAEVQDVVVSQAQLTEEVCAGFKACLGVIDELTRRNQALQHEVRELQAKVQFNTLSSLETT